MTSNYRIGFWRLADPKISLASFASLWLGACYAAAQQPLHWGWLLVSVAGIFCIEVAKNASGDIVDFDSGTDLRVHKQDRTPFSGGKRVLVDQLLSRRQTARIALAFYCLGIALGLLIVIVRDARVLPLGLAGVALAWCYHSSPLRLAYRGLGELAVALSYGPLIACGMYLVLTGGISIELVIVSSALGLLIAGFLWVNQFPDFDADKLSAKRNLVVRLGRVRASYIFPIIMAAAFGLAISASSVGSSAPLWGLLAVPAAGLACKRLLDHPSDSQQLVPAQIASLLSFVLFAVSVGTARLWL